ncbi:transcription-associated protein 1, partial [Spiromyces aspiralis]
GSGEAPKKILLPASQSFKVIAEIPIIIVSMFQALRGETHQYAQKLVPLVIQMLEINLSQPREGSDAANQGSSLAALMDLATAQSKALSFLAFLVRSFFQTVAPYRDKVAELVVKMIQMCPVEAIATRKEILIACRHIISTDMRLAFVPHLEQLLDLRILREPANSNHKMVKVYAISTLVDLVHSIRNELSLDHLTKVVDFYTSCMSDISLTPTIHTMCVKILFYIVESVAKFPDKKRVKYLLLSILHCYKCALSMLATRAKYTMTLAMSNDQDDSSSSSESNGSSGEKRAVLWRVEPDDLIHVSTLEPQDPVKECKTLLQTLITGCNPTLDKLKSCHSFLFEGPSAAEQHQQQSEKPSTDVADMGTSDMYNFELDQLKSLFHEGLRAFQIMKCAGQLGSTSSHAAATEKPRDDVKKDRSQTAPSRELQIRAIDRDEKALIEQFANLFLGLHPTVFQELISSQIGYLFDVMIDNAAMISASQLFLACVSTSPAFISTLLEYLGQRLPYLGTNDEVLSATMLHLYKIAFLALTFFPEQNEPVLRIYVQSIIRDALERSKTAQKPENYYLLLRSLFRCIGGGRYETLYSEVFPLLQTLLETFNTSLSVEGKPTPRQELVIDICLTVPVRLSALLPYLPLLMKPLMAALHAGPELVSQGLRTLELCVDNLTRDFLDPILNSFMDNLMESLWGLLTPNEQRSPHSRTAARILGKLGGRNRNMLGVQPTQLANNSVPVLQLPDNSATAIRLKFHNINEYVTLPISPGIETAVQTIESHYPPWLARHAYSNAFRFIKTTLLVLIEQQDASAPLSLLSRRSAADLEALGSKFMELFDNIETRKMLATLISLSTSGSPAELTIKEITEKPLASTSSASGDKDGSAEIDSAANGFSTDPQQAISLTGASPQVTFQLLWGAVVACSRDCIRDEATHLLDQLAHYIVAEHFVACIRAAKTNTLQDMAIPTLTFEGDASHMSGGNFTISVASGANCSLNLMAILVIARAISSHLQNVRMVGQRFLSTLVAATRGLLKGSQNYIYCVPHLHLLFSQLCQSCYYPDENVKMGACSGILFMITKLNLGKDWIEMHEIEGIKALLFVLKALSVEKVAQMCENVALEAVISIIGVCHSSVNPEVFVTVTEGDDKAMEIETGGDNKLEKKQAEGSTDSPSVGPSGEAKVNGSSNSDKGMPLAEKDVTGSPAKASEDGKKGPDAEKLGTQHVNGDMPDPGERRVEGGNERAEGEPQKVSKRPKIDISKDRTLSILLSIFAKELPNSNSLIREAVKTAIEHLAKLTGISTIDLLMPYRDRLLRSIFAKPLRALPHLMQIGRIDAITYCLDLSPDFIEINDEMMRLLSEALALTDAEDQALVNNPTQLRTYIPSLINLRHVCIKMLTSAISRPEFSQPRHSITRSRIISVFFKFLYSKSPKVVEVANDGLKRALTQQQRLPKDLLQAGLRPILLNLSDYKHLN